MTSAVSGKPLAAITGASSGIGLELAKEFARHGYDLIICAENSLDEAEAALRELGADVECVQVDLATYDGVEELSGRIETAGRPLDAVAINAGVGVGGEFAGPTSIADHLRVVELNVTSAVHLAKRVTPPMTRRRQGRVLFTSSVAALSPGPFLAVYAASKAFVLSFAEALHVELKDHGVTVTALLPGPTDTEFFDRAGMTDTKVATGPKDDPVEVARQGFEALMAGKHKVTVGSFGNKMQNAASRLLPEPVKADMQRRMAEPGSGD